VTVKSRGRAGTWRFDATFRELRATTRDEVVHAVTTQAMVRSLARCRFCARAFWLSLPRARTRLYNRLFVVVVVFLGGAFFFSSQSPHRHPTLSIVTIDN
jgi:hypothetical protein